MAGAEGLRQGLNNIIEVLTAGAAALLALDAGWDAVKSLFGFESATAHAAAVGDSIPTNA